MAGRSPCLGCAKRLNGPCWCPKLGAWQEAEFGEKRAAICRSDLLGRKRTAAARKAWATRRMSGEPSMERIEAEYYRRLRSLVLKAGGVKDRDYPHAPRWCRRRNGRPLDVLASEIRREGYLVSDANDLYELLEKAGAVA